MAQNRPVDMSSQQVDIKRAVMDDQTQILALFHRYLSSPPDSRQSIVEKILYRLASHLKLEELLLQEVRRRGPHGQKVAEDAALEHETVRIMILELELFEGDDDQAMDEYFEDMMQSVRTLFITEERDLLAFLNRSLDA